MFLTENWHGDIVEHDILRAIVMHVYQKGDGFMDDSGPTATLFLFIVILLIDIVIYGFAGAIENLREEDLEKDIEDNKQSKRDSAAQKSVTILKYLENNSRLKYSTQVFGFIANIIIGRFCISSFGKCIKMIPLFSGIPFADVITTIIAAVVIIWMITSFGVVIPYRLGSRAPLKWSRTLLTGNEFVMAVLTPFTGLIRITASGILRLFGVKDTNDDADVTEEEIISMVTEGQEQGVLQDSEADMITNIFEFSDKQAKDIMTHRKSMVAIDGTMNLQEAVNFMLDSNNSRFPVYLDNIDHIIGILHIKDAMKLLACEDADKELPIRKIKGLLRQPKYVPETKNIDSLFHSMQSSKTQMVIVIDEYGQTSGLVSMEDILEEIVGNILDEYDDDIEYIEPTDNAGEFIIEGKTPLDDLEKRFNVEFEEEDFETLNGLLISKMEHIPVEGEEYNCDIKGFNFKVLEIKNHMITSVLVTKLSATEEDDIPSDSEGSEEKA